MRANMRLNKTAQLNRYTCLSYHQSGKSAGGDALFADFSKQMGNRPDKDSCGLHSESGDPARRAPRRLLHCRREVRPASPIGSFFSKSLLPVFGGENFHKKRLTTKSSVSAKLF
ncbi:hypothetical protein L2D08_00565 [Domibacillus sp. PGB-M46]|uniref:hypothetical protein n=1 Tax=Domibacillus sp. PGB-M46 TaxID=2910255 RepID=UPI001F5683DF|nr:hypothetical protein [Domibacillus sp. PGB-M46]MCI2252851.1 hypothetical protein [Domibacillus sp. PGB-M46]